MHIIHLLTYMFTKLLMIGNPNIGYASALGGDGDDDPIVPPNVSYITRLLFASQV